MISIGKNLEVTICRGDSVNLPLSIYTGDALSQHLYNIENGDTIYFGVYKAGSRFEYSIIKKSYQKQSEKDDLGRILITLNPCDTENLRDGTYKYSVFITKSSNQSTFSLISDADFIIIIKEMQI